ncbi:uncharacterized protein LOC100207928 [Hydra vulgaris]|uniref:uncharacterized protein LOC100207928 n=1 Tax=Hydra vulgaris TaxID=6087 RepID=UPI001F5F975D|nr:uncharacterized protein LOC100207928 [Hydra vulgaris]
MFYDPLSKRKMSLGLFGSCMQINSSEFSNFRNSSSSSKSFSKRTLQTNQTAKKNKWPSLVLLTKAEELVIVNGRNRRRFPDPVRDRSILLACLDPFTENMLYLCHCKHQRTINANPAVFKQRVTLDDDECQYFISLDIIQIDDSNDTQINYDDILKNFLIADVREHAIAGECLPAGVSGYWVRIFGPQRKFKFIVSLWRDISENIKSRTDGLMKIGEICINILNTGVSRAKKKQKKNNALSASRTMMNSSNINISNSFPSFCSRELYILMSTSLRECLENGKFDLFEEMYSKFSGDLTIKNQDNIELNHFLSSEKALFLAMQGKLAEAKHLLQTTVEKSVPKSPNKIFLLNKAYLVLTNVHIIEGNYGTAEECLNVLQVDKKNGTPFDDAAFFYYLYGIILMNFGKSLQAFSSSLWKESYEAFINSLNSFDQSSPSMLNQRCKIILNIIRLSLYAISRKIKIPSISLSELCPICNDISDVKECIKMVEMISLHKMSARTFCLLNLVKAEVVFNENNWAAGYAMLEDLEKECSKLKFKDISLLGDSVRSWWRSKEYKEFMLSIENDCVLDLSSENVTQDTYGGDESGI